MSRNYNFYDQVSDLSRRFFVPASIGGAAMIGFLVWWSGSLGALSSLFTVRRPREIQDKKRVTRHHKPDPNTLHESMRPDDEAERENNAKASLKLRIGMISGATEHEKQGLYEALSQLENENISLEKLEGTLKTLRAKSEHKPLLLIIYEEAGCRLLELLKMYKTEPKELTADIVHILASCFHNSDVRSSFPEAQLTHIIDALLNVDEQVVHESLRALMNLSCSNKYESLIRNYNGMTPIIGIIKGNSSDKVKSQAIRTLVNLVYDHENQKIVINEGLIDYLIELLRKNNDADLSSRVLRVLGFLSDAKSSPQAYSVIASTDVIGLVSDVFRNINDSTVEVTYLNLTSTIGVFLTKLFKANAVNETTKAITQDAQGQLRQYIAEEQDQNIITKLLEALVSRHTKNSATDSVTNCLFALQNLSIGQKSELFQQAIRRNPLFGNIEQCRNTTAIPKIQAKAADVMALYPPTT